jgi:hypothetical protein
MVYGASHGGKYIGTYKDVHEGAEARNAYTGAQLGHSNHNDTSRKHNEVAVQVKAVQVKAGQGKSLTAKAGPRRKAVLDWNCVGLGRSAAR